MTANLVLSTDSYKLGHYNQYLNGTENVYSYFESRTGAEFPNTVFFGLQHIIKEKLLHRVTISELNEAAIIASSHFSTNSLFNYDGWKYIIEELGGKLPLRIKAAPEGSVIPTGNVLMTVENTNPRCWWLTNYVESLLTHVWYPSTVATLSYHVKQDLKGSLEDTADTTDALPFMLHDFGYRSAVTDDAAGIGGAAHLLNFQGTDTLLGILTAMNSYKANLKTLGFSVPATEHSVMTSAGADGEFRLVGKIIQGNPTGVVSVVADSYDYYEHVKALGTNFKAQIMARDGKYVVRPDSVTPRHPKPSEVIKWTLKQLWYDFGGAENRKGNKVLSPHVGILWGDGLDKETIVDILSSISSAGFSTESVVFGMGGGLLQKLDRDTQRFAFKCAAQKRNKEWFAVSKKPLDHSKESKSGRMALARDKWGYYTTAPISMYDSRYTYNNTDQLQTVYENGKLMNEQTFEQIRERA